MKDIMEQQVLSLMELGWSREEAIAQVNLEIFSNFDICLN